MEESELIRTIEERTKQKYKDKHGNRDESTLSSEELERVTHEAAVEVQRERRREE